MNNEDLNSITLSGKINSIFKTENYVFFGMTCETYATDKHKALASLRIYKDLYLKYKDLFFKDNKVFIKGYLSSYTDKSNNIFTYIMVTDISDCPQELGLAVPHIRYDTDGVMVWNGKRCESEPMSEEELKEMEDLLSEYR